MLQITDMLSVSFGRKRVVHNYMNRTIDQQSHLRVKKANGHALDY